MRILLFFRVHFLDYRPVYGFTFHSGTQLFV